MAYGDATVVVTWADGGEETIACYDVKVSDGVLYLTQRMDTGQPTRAIPLSSMRSWTEAR